MKTVIPQEKKIAAALGLLALLIAGVLYWEWQQGMQLRQELLTMRNIPVTGVPDQKVLPEFNLPPAEAGFPEINARSLFAPNRRPPAPVKVADAAMKKGSLSSLVYSLPRSSTPPCCATLSLIKHRWLPCKESCVASRWTRLSQRVLSCGKAMKPKRSCSTSKQVASGLPQGLPRHPC